MKWKERRNAEDGNRKMKIWKARKRDREEKRVKDELEESSARKRGDKDGKEEEKYKYESTNEDRSHGQETVAGVGKWKKGTGGGVEEQRLGRKRKEGQTLKTERVDKKNSQG